MIKARGKSTTLQMGVRGSRRLWSNTEIFWLRLSVFQQKSNISGNILCDKAVPCFVRLCMPVLAIAILLTLQACSSHYFKYRPD